MLVNDFFYRIPLSSPIIVNRFSFFIRFHKIFDTTILSISFSSMREYPEFLASSISGETQNFASPCPEQMCICFLVSSLEKKKNLYPLTLNTVGILFPLILCSKIILFLIKVNLCGISFFLFERIRSRSKYASIL